MSAPPYTVEAQIAGRIARTTTDTEAEARACAQTYLANGAAWVHVTKRDAPLPSKGVSQSDTLTSDLS